MRTDDFRYTEWAKWDGRTQRPVWEVRAKTNIGKSQSQRPRENSGNAPRTQDST